MSDPRDNEKIKLSADDILDVEIKDEDLKHLDLGDDLSADDLLDDDFSDPAPRSRRRKSSARKGPSMTLLVALMVIAVLGGAYVLLTGQETPMSQPVAPAPVAEQTPVPMPEGGEGTPQNVANLPETGVPPAGFDDLPQPDLSGVVPDTGSLAPEPTTDLPPPPAPETLAQPEIVSPAPVVPSETVAEPIPTTGPEPATTAVAPPPASEPAPAPEVETSPTILAQPAPKPAVPVVESVPVAPPLPAVEALEQPKAIVSAPPAPPVSPVTAGDMAADEYLESLDPTQAAAKAGERRLVVPPDQFDRNLGVTVGETSTVGVTTSDSMGVEIESRISAARRALDLERYQAAFDMFDSLYQTNKRDERILMGRAVALQKLARNEEAIKAYDELLALNPTSPEVMTNMLGLVRQQYPSAALQRLMELRQRYPNNAVVAAQTGLANAGVGNFEEALRYLGIAAGLEPENPKHPFNMAVIAERMGNPDLAVSYYERALKADAVSNNPQNKVNRDMIYDRLSLLRQR